MRFDQLNISQFILRALDSKGIYECTDIQAATIPLLLSGKDVIGKSRTGSGKTFAFGIPAVESALSENADTQALVVCPTRELAMQVCEQLRLLNSFREGCKVVPLVGGINMARQVNYLKKNAQIVVGTPGRICDHLRRRTLKLDGLNTLVLDEADEMLKMGFKEDIEKIFAKSPSERRTVMFSATMPKEILALAKAYMKEPSFVETDDEVTRSVDQYYVSVGLKSKDVALKKLIKRLHPQHSIVFCNTKRMVDKLTASLSASDISAVGIHGDMKQGERKAALESLKSRDVKLLIATDVAARGIDVDGVDIVFNYDVPQTAEYYTHRIGRTGRADKVGMAITLINTRWGMEQLEEIFGVTGNYAQELELDLGEARSEKRERKPSDKPVNASKAPNKKSVSRSATATKKASKNGVKAQENKTKSYKSAKTENARSDKKSADLSGERLKNLRDFVDGYGKSEKTKSGKKTARSVKPQKSARTKKVKSVAKR